MDSLWQRLFNAVKERFQEIRVPNGYQSNIGAQCFAWRDLSRSPFTAADLAESIGGFTIKDTRRESGVGGQWAKLGRHEHRLTIEISAASFASATSPPDNFARTMLADMDRCIGRDRYWEIAGVKLARETLPVEDVIEVAHAGDRLVIVRKTFTIVFVTALFDPDTQ